MSAVDDFIKRELEMGVTPVEIGEHLAEQFHDGCETMAMFWTGAAWGINEALYYEDKPKPRLRLVE